MQWINKIDDNKIKELDSDYFHNLVNLVESFKLAPEQEFQLLIGCITNIFASSLCALLSATSGAPPQNFIDNLLLKTKETIQERLNINIPNSHTTH